MLASFVMGLIFGAVSGAVAGYVVGWHAVLYEARARATPRRPGEGPEIHHIEDWYTHGQDREC